SLFLSAGQSKTADVRTLNQRIGAKTQRNGQHTVIANMWRLSIVDCRSSRGQSSAHRVRRWFNLVSSNRRISMKTFATLALFAGLGLGHAPAQAVPLAPLAQSEAVILVAGGCGPGMHRGPYGGCRQNFAN